MTRLRPHKDSEEGETRGGEDSSPFIPLLRLKSSRPPSHPSFPPPLLLSETGRLLWQQAKGYSGIYQRGGGGGGDVRGEKTKHTPNKEIEQEKEKKGCIWRPLFFFHKAPLLYSSPCSFRVAQTKEARLAQCAPSSSPAHFKPPHSIYCCFLRAPASALCVCFQELVMVMVGLGVVMHVRGGGGVFICWGSYRPRGPQLWRRFYGNPLLSKRSTTGDFFFFFAEVCAEAPQEAGAEETGVLTSSNTLEVMSKSAAQPGVMTRFRASRTPTSHRMKSAFKIGPGREINQGTLRRLGRYWESHSQWREHG